MEEWEYKLIINMEEWENSLIINMEEWENTVEFPGPYKKLLGSD